MEQRLWQTFSQTNEWVRYSDGKAVALLGIQGVLIGLAVTFLKDFLTGTSLSVVSMVLFIAGLIFIVTAVICTFLCLTPRLKNSGKISPIFFQSIAANFNKPEDYRQFITENFNTDENASKALAEQVHANSKIATIKFRWVSWSTGLTVLGLIFWAIFLIIMLF